MPDNVPAIKTGFATSEFWGHLIVTIGGLLIASGIIHVPESGPFAGLIGGVIALLSQGTYTFSRTSIKNAALNAGIAAGTAFISGLQQPSGSVTLSVPQANVITENR